MFQGIGQDAVNNTLVGYVEQPNGRGTLSILFSCLVTLSLCVWSAVHLDLPEHGEGNVSYTFKYLKWSTLGVFGPELILWVAWRQFMSARALTGAIRRIQHSHTQRDEDEWSDVHSFYAGMGGFVFDLEDSDFADELPFISDTKIRRLHITPRGIRLLAKCDLLPRISKDEIEDKSKADVTAKIICCAQVTWIAGQTITRLICGLTISPLEINTMAHVACALMMYALWWSKPRCIKQPTKVKGQWARALCAYMYMSSQVSAEKRGQRDVLRNFGVKPELEILLYNPPYTSDESESRSEAGGATLDDQSSDTTGHASTYLTGDASCDQHSISSSVTSSQSNGKHALVESSTRQQLRWELCSDTIEKYAAMQDRFRARNPTVGARKLQEALHHYPSLPQKVWQKLHNAEEASRCPSIPEDCPEGKECIIEELVVDKPRNWPGDDLIQPMQGQLMGIILWCGSTIYGAIHVAAWNGHFPTDIEAWLWRSSGLYLIFSGLLWSAVNLVSRYSSSMWLYWYDLLTETEPRKSYGIVYVLSTIGGIAYVFARTYLVVEAFISLRALPASVYQSPSWILTIPHIG